MKGRQNGFRFPVMFSLLAVLVGIGFAGWYVWWHQQPKTTKQITTQASTQSGGWNKTIMSGKGAFNMTFPDGWQVQRDTNSDAFMVSGEAQPEIKRGVAPIITSSAFGSDGPVVLFVTLFSGDVSVPKGTAQDYILENGKVDPIQGKKYTYIYPADEVAGALGGQRLQGDRDYTYLFNVGNGRHLEILYSIYGSDPRNNIAIIDELVRTIRLN